VFGQTAQTPILTLFKMTKAVYLSLSLLLAIACTSTNKTVEKSTSEASVLPDSIYRFTVSFISIGSGIDGKERQRFNVFVAQFNSDNEVTITPEMVNWGREGETDYCIEMADLSDDLQTKFIAETKELLNASTLVRYKENSVCRQKRH